MSLRPEISGFDLAAFRRLIDGAEPARAAEVADRVAEEFTPEGRAAAHELTRRIVSGELTAGSIEVEDELLVAVVISLAYLDQEHSETMSSIWKSIHFEFVDQASRRATDPDGTAGPDSRAATLLEYALLERPLFGTYQDTGWSSYGFLSHAEVGELLDHHRRDPAPLAGHDELTARFGADFVGWLTEIHRAGRDYWFHSA